MGFFLPNWAEEKGSTEPEKSSENLGQNVTFCTFRKAVFMTSSLSDLSYHSHDFM